MFSQNWIQKPNERDDGDGKWHGIYKELKKYCCYTTLHGFKYVVDKTLQPIERLLWLICCILAVIGTLLFIQPNITKYQSSPFVSSIADKGMPIWGIDFPAVTLCNVNKAMKSKVTELNRKPPWNKYKEETLYKAVNLLGYFGRAMNYFEFFEDDQELKDMLNDDDNDITKFMEESMHPLNRTLVECWWKGQKDVCMRLFRIKRTDDGFCLSFNSANLKELIKPKRDRSEVVNTTRIWKLNAAGAHMGLTVLLNPLIEEYYTTIDTYHGFQVLLHHSFDYPDVSHEGFIISPGKEVYVAVTPKPNEISRTLDKYTPKFRQCQKKEEGDLHFFTAYTHTNCMVECRIKSFNETCGCIPYNYYETSLAETGKTCNFNASKCILTNFEVFNSVQKGDRSEGMKCNCASSCYFTEYAIELSTADFHPNKDLMLMEKNITGSNLIQLRVFYKDWFYPLYKRRVLYSWYDMLASVGGVMGMFMGFSIISLVELVYYCTIRPWFMYKERKNRERVQLLKKDFENSKIFRMHTSDIFPHY